jgi:hypothetical protein
MMIPQMQIAVVMADAIADLAEKVKFRPYLACAMSYRWAGCK